MFIVASYLCQLMLFVTGWTVDTQHLQQYRQLSKSNLRTVYVFPHSTLADAVLYVISHVAYDLPICAPMIYWWFEKPVLGPLLRRLGFFPLRGKRDGGTGGTVDRIIAALQENYVSRNRGFAVWISPEGSRFKQPRWGSGFYNIAKALDAQICVGAADYERHRIYFEASSPIDPKRLEYQEAVAELEKKLAQYVPRYPDQVSPPVSRPYQQDHVSFADQLVLTNAMMIIPVLGYAWKLGVAHPLVLQMTISSVLSTWYHRSKESSAWLQTVETRTNWLSACGVVYYFREHMMSNMFPILFILVTLFTFYMGSGRKAGQPRRHHYVCYHSTFHLMVMLLGVYLLLTLP